MPFLKGCTPHNILTQTRVREMSEVEAAWVGAFIDAEGFVGVMSSYSDALQIVVYSTEPEYISALLRVTGCGNVTYREPKGLSNLPQLRWSITARLDVRTLAKRLSPYSIKVRKVL